MIDHLSDSSLFSVGYTLLTPGTIVVLIALTDYRTTVKNEDVQKVYAVVHGQWIALFHSLDACVRVH